jgi:hypothetical protein
MFSATVRWETGRPAGTRSHAPAYWGALAHVAPRDQHQPASPDQPVHELQRRGLAAARTDQEHALAARRPSDAVDGGVRTEALVRR